MKLTENDCWFLIKAEDHNHPDPATDAAGCYKRGDLVQCYPGTIDMPFVRNKGMFMVGVVGMGITEGKSVVAPQTNHNIGTGEDEVVKRRRYFAEEVILPAHIDDFNDCVATGRPFMTTREAFLYYSLTDKVA